MTKMLRMSEEDYAKRQKVTVRPITVADFQQMVGITPAPKRKKYLNQPQYFDRVNFASKAELARYKDLRFLQDAGTIRDLVVHPIFPLRSDGGDVIGRYAADFRYIALQPLPNAGDEVIEDVKSPRTAKTAAFRRTLKHIKAQYGIDVQIVM